MLTSFAVLLLPLTALAALNCALKSDMTMTGPQNQERKTVVCISGHAVKMDVRSWGVTSTSEGAMKLSAPYKEAVRMRCKTLLCALLEELT